MAFHSGHGEDYGYVLKSELDASWSLMFSSVYSFFPNRCIAAEASAFADFSQVRH